MKADFLNISKYVGKETLKRIAVITAVMALFVIFVLMPTVKKKNDLKDKAKSVSDDLVRAQRKIANFADLKEEEINTEKLVERYYKGIIVEDDKTSLIGDVSDLAKKAGVKVISFKQKNYSETFPNGFCEYFKPLYYEFVLESGYHEFGKFVNYVENNDIYLKVLKISIEKNGKNPRKHKITMLIASYAKLK